MYNSLTALPKLPYNIMTFLATKDEVIWKMLKYNGYDALSQPNLTFEEKMELVWNKNQPQEQYGVFLTPLIEDSITDSKCVMKLYNYYDEADNQVLATITYCFEFIYGGKMSLVEYDGVPVSRGDLFINRILSVLNGSYIGGVGYLEFDSDKSRYSAAKAIMGNSKTFTGVALYMAVQAGDTGGESYNECE